MNYPEKFGILVALGMNHEQAAEIAGRPGVLNIGQMEEHYKLEAEKPFVREDKDAYVIVSRDHEGYEYEITKVRVQSANDILGWVDQLSGKAWVTPKHIRKFVLLASHNLGLKIHPI